MPAVSVIMGIYNCEDTLEESLASIEAQTYADWECILCDDGSRDSTLKIACEFAQRHSGRVVVLKNERNMGLNATLNRCLEAASGIYIARQDGDDVSLPERFEKEVRFLDAHPEYAIVSTDMLFYDEDGTWGKKQNVAAPQRLDLFREGPCFCHAPCMVRKEAFDAVNGYTVAKRHLRCEDVNLWYKLYEAGYRGFNIHEALYMMRDDRHAYKRRTFQNRMNIIMTEWDGMRRLKCKGLEYRFFAKKALRQLILAFMPEKLYMHLHRKKLRATGINQNRKIA